MRSIFKSEFRNPSRTTGRVGTKEKSTEKPGWNQQDWGAWK